MKSRTNLFGDLDRMDLDAWAEHLAPDAVLRCGNDDPVLGREACRAAMASLYGQLRCVQHQILDQWEHGPATIAEANVTITRSDGRDVEVPSVTIYRTNGGDLIADYRVYVDLAPVFA
ncbi:MAG TPA: nuclear transport factor 2 family protein [Solirubrobacteraceae bacterium]